MTAIFIKFVRFWYNWIPMVMCTSGDIFQTKLYELIDVIKVTKTYIDYILVLRKDYLPGHI